MDIEFQSLGTRVSTLHSSCNLTPLCEQPLGVAVDQFWLLILYAVDFR